MGLVDQSWGIWYGSSVSYNSEENPPIPYSWTAYAEGETYGIVYSEEGAYWDLVGYWGSQITGNRINIGNKLVGSSTGYFADISSSPIPITGISVGETFGTFDPNAYTWQAISMGVWLETNKFLEMAANEVGRGKLQQLNIPCFEVGRASLSGSGFSEGGSINVNMNDVIFFAPNTGGQPSIWATNSVGGHYTGNPINAVVPLNGDGLSANFGVQHWDTNNNVWLSRIQNGSGTLNRVDVPGTVTINNFQGAAAGTINQGAGTFSGTGAGIAK
jgi:hypothetical protein